MAKAYGKDGLKFIYDRFEVFHIQSNSRTCHELTTEIFKVKSGNYDIDSFKYDGNKPLTAWHSKPIIT